MSHVGDSAISVYYAIFCALGAHETLAKFGCKYMKKYKVKSKNCTILPNRKYVSIILSLILKLYFSYSYAIKLCLNI